MELNKDNKENQPSLNETTVRVDKVRKQFGRRLALNNLSFSLGKGEFLTVLGRNGAGKTTLLQILSALARPTAGKVYIFGQELKPGAVELRKEIGLIAHQTLLYNDLTAIENLRFYAKIYNLPDLEERISELLEKVGLSGRRNDPVRSFSRGMQQRLAIARALLHRPRLLLLDEPFTGLDFAAADLLTEMITEGQEKDAAVILVTHNLERGWNPADRLAILDKGSFVFQERKENVSMTDLRENYTKYCAGN